eukprot:4314027-Lingulodinium_polyedra.AAC.1
MFEIVQRDGQELGRCKPCGKDVHGKGCMHCVSKAHLWKLEEFLERHQVEHGPVDPCFAPRGEDEAPSDE